MDLDLFVSNATWVRAQLPVVSAQLAAVGISVRPRVGATSEFFATDAVAGRYDLALCSGDPSALGADGAFVLGWYLTGAWQREYLHWTGTEARAIGKLLSEAALTEEPKARRALLARVQRDAAAHGPLVVLGHRAQPTAWAADLFGIRPSGSTGLDLVGVAGRSLLGR